MVTAVSARFRVGTVKMIQGPLTGDDGRYIKEEDGSYKHGDVSMEVELFAVHTPDPKNENFTYSKSTPSGSMKILVDNSAVWGFYKPNQELDLVFTEYVRAPQPQA